MPEISTQHIEKLAELSSVLSAIVAAAGRGKPNVSAEIHAAVEQLVRKGICLRCEKKKAGRYTRGQCASCYNDSIRAINEGEVLESDMVEMGRLLERAPGGRKTDRPAVQQLTPINLPPERQPSQDEDDALGQFQEAVRNGKAWPDMLPGDKELTTEGMEATVGYAKGRRTSARRRKGKKSDKN
jgi:hypothetical protein